MASVNSIVSFETISYENMVQLFFTAMGHSSTYRDMIAAATMVGEVAVYIHKLLNDRIQLISKCRTPAY